MKLIFIFFFLVFCCCGYSQSKLLQAYWNDKLRFKSEGDPKLDFAIGGRIHIDANLSRHSPELNTLAGPINNIINIRRARLSFEGNYNNAIQYEIEFTFGEQINFADIYVAFLQLPLVERLTIGHFREPVGMEENYNSNRILFMERSLTSVYAPGRNTGIMLQRNLGQNARVYTGIFRRTNASGGAINETNNYSFAGRIAWAPVHNQASNQTLHVGLSGNYFAPANQTFAVRTDNETHTGATYVRSAQVQGASRVSQLAGELAFSFGQFNFHSEYIQSFTRLSNPVDSLGNTRRNSFYSYYGTVSYFLKNGQRKYTRASNLFDAIALAENKPGTINKGAWEAALRYAHINVAEDVSNLPFMSDITLGINYYINTNSRLMLNLVHSIIYKKYTATSLQCRVQFTL